MKTSTIIIIVFAILVAIVVGVKSLEVQANNKAIFTTTDEIGTGKVPGTTAKVEKASGDNTYPEIIAKIVKYMGELEKGHPDAMKSFYALDQAVLKPGALDTKSKELICLGIAVAIRCDDCIAFHTHGSLEAGATEEEIVEALGVAILMGGGPSVAYATHAMEAMEQFKTK